MREQIHDTSGGKADCVTRLACLHLPGCVACASVQPVAELLESRLVAVESIDCSEDYSVLERMGGEATPYWCLVEGDAVVASLYPADDIEELYVFVKGIDADLSRESFDEALAEGRRKADIIEACQAELAVRSPDTDATELMGAARLKIAKPCLSLSDDADVRTCIERGAAKLEDRLRERMAMPGGDTPARREVIEGLPALVDQLFSEVVDILKEARHQQQREA